MSVYEVEVESEEEDAICPHCDGDGIDPETEEDTEIEDDSPPRDCPVCCGFGILNW
jgi:hypothetical protein